MTKTKLLSYLKGYFEANLIFGKTEDGVFLSVEELENIIQKINEVLGEKDQKGDLMVENPTNQWKPSDINIPMSPYGGFLVNSTTTSTYPSNTNLTNS